MKRNKIKLVSFAILSICIGMSVSAQQLPVKSITIPAATDTIQIWDVSLSPDGSKMAVVELGPSFCPSLWDVQSGQRILKIAAPDKIDNASETFQSSYSTYGAVFAPDGKHVLIYGQPYYFALYEADTGKLVYTYLTQQPPYGKPYGLAFVETASFSPDGKKLLVGDFTGSLQLRDAYSGELVKTVLSNRRSPKIQFLPDSLRCFVEYGFNSFILDSETKEQIKTFSDGGCRISQNGKKLIYLKQKDSTVELWDLEKMESTIIGHIDALKPWKFALSDDDLIVSYSKIDKETKKADSRKVYDAKSLKKLYEYPVNINAGKDDPTGEDEMVRFFPDGKKFLTVNGFTVHIYDLKHLDSKIKDDKVY